LAKDGITTIMPIRLRRHSLAWYEVDVNWMGIRALKALGLAKVRLVALDGSMIDDESEPAIETAA
jgi:hypothetical protein